MSFLKFLLKKKVKQKLLKQVSNFKKSILIIQDGRYLIKVNAKRNNFRALIK